MGVCTDWMTSEQLVECGCPNGDPVQIARWIAMSQQMIYLLSGSRFSGPCTQKWRPALPYDGCGSSMLYPHLIDGQVWNLPTGWNSSALYLPFDWPREVEEVRIDGAIIDPADYRLDQATRTIHLRDRTWPLRQDLALEDTEPGTWSVTVTHGEDPPALLIGAAIDYAVELGKGCSGLACALPARAVSIAKQGITIDLQIAQELLNAGRTGLASVDAALTAINPAAQRQRARFVSVDVPGTWH